MCAECRLEPREQKIIQERFLSEDPKTLDALAKLFAVSRERIRQIEKNALGKLKKFCLETKSMEDFI